MSRCPFGGLFLCSGITEPREQSLSSKPEGIELFWSALSTSRLSVAVRGLEVFSAWSLFLQYFLPAAFFLLVPIAFNLLYVHAYFDLSGILLGSTIGIVRVSLAYIYRDIFHLVLFQNNNNQQIL
jgi:hypothetical protein